MLTKKELGRRLRVARFEKGLTLKDVARLSGMSATHISEVERGKTSPTIGALQRITKALEENPAHFVREEDLPTVVFTRASDGMTRYNTDATGRPGQFDVLSGGLPGGCVQVLRRSLPPGTLVEVPPRVGEMVIVCTGGAARVTFGEEQYVVREGDTIQFRMDEGHRMETLGDEPASGYAFFASPFLFTS